MTNHKEHWRTASAENPAQAGELQYPSEGLFGTWLPVMGTAEDPEALPGLFLKPLPGALLLMVLSPCY